MEEEENPNWIIISNLDYDFVDIHFDNKTDFANLLKFLVRYIQDTNDYEWLKDNYEFPPIKVIVDEAHIYLFFPVISKHFEKIHYLYWLNVERELSVLILLLKN